ncbi:agmatine deiminase family protein [Salinisphaera aquimarina]|uniref:Agmatine/peptidylarginine deiminase n=1 Tax=Salinisphaera aquimarina TaxID=2094031 RepID=A0ABV7EP12_9GAMM
MSARRLPPEWAHQQAMLLVWPRDGGDWGNGLAAARDVSAAMAAALCKRQQVILVCADDECAYSIAAHPLLAELGHARLKVVQVANDDIWARDTGPLTVIENGARLFLDFRFDGWGGQFDAGHDDRLTAALHAAGAYGAGTLERREHTLEGGSIEVNGDGALLTTERCLIAGRRNANIDRDAAQSLLANAFGVDTVHWLAHGDLIGDDTDGHIDTLARFAATDTIVYQGCDDPADAHHAPLTAMAAELAALRDRHDTPYRLVELPLPAPIHDPDDGHRLPAGYANFLIANGCVLAPAFNDPADEPAHAILAGLFPNREIIPIDSRALIRQHGGLHCAAMQIPAIPSAS